MKLTINDTKESPLLSRKEIAATVNYKGATPSRAKIIDELAKAAKAKPEMIILVKADSLYGVEEARVEAHIYENEAAMKLNEPAHLIARMKKAFEKPAKADEKPAPEPVKEAAPEKKPVKDAPADKPAKVEEKPAEKAKAKSAEKPVKDAPVEKAEPVKEAAEKPTEQ